MIVKQLTLKNFRNHDSLSFNFEPNINVLSGPNGVGKTNVMEAIYYLSLARSFKNTDNVNLISKGSDSAEVSAVITEGSQLRKIHIVINRDGRKVFINNKPVSRISDLSKAMNVVLFEPKDVSLFSGPPRARRNFLDISISKKSDPYLEYISRYERVLRKRNDILKNGDINKTLLDTTTEMLIKLSGPIISYRQMYIKDINDILTKITRALTGEENKIEVVYKPFVEYGPDFNREALKAFSAAETNDIRRKMTTIGAHREDFSVNLNGRNIAEFGSQGENRIIALALKISPYFIIEDKDKRPVVVLDDVMSELDDDHCRRLIAFLKKLEQVFITATQLEVIGANQYQLKSKKQGGLLNGR
ncbi:MAG TPA: DNA replication/repair protein RecF [Bacilli bacterium]|nr:DNA replication/repair protein RecF [Bacilli bacterium]HPS18531.1 DNA replication/repair protein RecF [Bacilli bacterium]